MITSIDSNGLRFDIFTGEERFIAPNAVLVSARTDAVLIDCGNGGLILSHLIRPR